MTIRKRMSLICGFRTWPMYAMLMAAPVFAHHSFAGYDMARTLSAPATIKEFRWGAPHSAAVFTIKNPDGKTQDINVGSAAPAMFLKQGFQPKDFKAGVKVQLTWHPTKSGKPGGITQSITLPDGRTFKDQEAFSQATNVDQLAEPKE